jgi:hypothetical protein
MLHSGDNPANRGCRETSVACICVLARDVERLAFRSMSRCPDGNVECESRFLR